MLVIPPYNLFLWYFSLTYPSAFPEQALQTFRGTNTSQFADFCSPAASVCNYTSRTGYRGDPSGGKYAGEPVLRLRWTHHWQRRTASSPRQALFHNLHVNPVIFVSYPACIKVYLCNGFVCKSAYKNISRKSAVVQHIHIFADLFKLSCKYRVPSRSPLHTDYSPHIEGRCKRK